MFVFTLYLYRISDGALREERRTDALNIENLLNRSGLPAAAAKEIKFTAFC